MTVRPPQTMSPVLPADQEKPVYVRRMFARIAPTYDLMNRLMTGGQDVAWRRLAVELCDLPAKGLLLDVGTGTGDLARAAEAQVNGAAAVGLDFTFEMLAAGTPPRWGFAQGDALALPFEDNRFDAVVSGFLLRNLVEREAALAEQARVTKPGGRVVCLETTPPAPGSPLAPVLQFYLMGVIPLLGGLVSGDREAYAYLPQSTARFMPPEDLARLMERVGLRDVSYVRRMFGAVAIHVGTKRGG